MAVILEEILAEAAKAGASDVNITVDAPPRMRVNGNLTSLSYPKCGPEDTLEMLISILPETERARFEEQGECECAFTVRGVGRVRACAYRQRGRIALAFRLTGGLPSAEELGIPKDVMELYAREAGLIVVTGESGSGRSSTLAALVDRINMMRNVHIITLERPVEYIHEHKQSIVEQREIGRDSMGYPAALAAALRENADVIVVSELSDPETVDGAVTAAETGHLVLASANVPGTTEAIERLVELFPAQRQQRIRSRLADVLEAVIYQQLLPYEGKKKRMAAFEVLHMAKEIRRLLREGKTGEISAVMEKGQIPGVVTMDDAVEKLYKEGRISKEILMWYARKNHYI